MHNSAELFADISPLAVDQSRGLALYTNTDFPLIVEDLTENTPEYLLVQAMYFGESLVNRKLLDCMSALCAKGVSHLCLDLEPNSIPGLSNKFGTWCSGVEDAPDGLVWKKNHNTGYRGRNHARYVVAPDFALIHAMWHTSEIYKDRKCEPVYASTDPEIIELLKGIFYSDGPVSVDYQTALGNRLVFATSGEYILDRAGEFLNSNATPGDSVTISSSWYPDFLLKPISGSLEKECNVEVCVNNPTSDFCIYEFPFFATKAVSLGGSLLNIGVNVNFFKKSYHGKFIVIEHTDGSPSDLFLTTSNFLIGEGELLKLL